MSTIVNLTPHTLNMITDAGTVEIPSTGLARVAMTPDALDGALTANGIEVPVYKTSTSGAVTGLDEPKAGTTYVVSRQVYDACPDRDDLVIPHQAVRGEDGRIIGCKAFARPVRTA